jgi:hypothetical protein
MNAGIYGRPTKAARSSKNKALTHVLNYAHLVCSTEQALIKLRLLKAHGKQLLDSSFSSIFFQQFCK